jgi:tetratricopeptide (TPR) repeat protein
VVAFRLLPKSASPPTRFDAPDLLIVSALAFVTFVLFAHAAQNDFIYFDDWDYVAANPDVQAGLTFHSLRWALTTFHASNWHPLTWISHEADCQLFGRNPYGPHLVNAGIHAINTSLLFAVLLLATARRWPSAICAALFGWHPLRVESVAWIAERKDVLSVFFFLLTLLAYLRYARQPTLKAYALVFLSLTLGLLAKPMLVMAPLLLLLLDYWPLKRISDATSLRLLVIEKLPLFPLSIASAIVTIYAQHSGGALVPFGGTLTLYRRLNNSACSIIAYIAKLLLPIKLAPYYIFPMHQSLWRFLGALVLLTLITLLCIMGRRNRPYLLVGWLWFIASLLPVIGLLQVGAQSMADRYSYIPCIGLLVAIVWSAADWYDRQKSVRPLLIAIGVCATIALLPMTYRQIGRWRNDLTLFTYTCSVTQENWFCEGILADVLVHQGDLEDAEMHIRKSLSILPRYPSSEETLARIQRLSFERLPGEAEYAREIRANPSDPLPHYNWANLLLRDGRVGGAIIHYLIYVDARPNDQRAHNNLGIALAMGGDLPAAEAELDKAVELDPAYADAQFGLGTVLLRQGKYSQAATSFVRALQLDPGMRKAQTGLDQCRSQLGAGPSRN